MRLHARQRRGRKGSADLYRTIEITHRYDPESASDCASKPVH